MIQNNYKRFRRYYSTFEEFLETYAVIIVLWSTEI